MESSQDLQDPNTLNKAGLAALDQYWTGGQMVDLNRAVECWRKALNLISPDSPNWAILLSNLGLGLQTCYAHNGEFANLKAAITAFQQALEAAPPDSLDRPTLLNNLGLGLRT